MGYNTLMLRKLKNLYHLGQSMAGMVLFKGPTEGITFIGVTGTDGKTTTSSLLYHILTVAGHKVALISTISAVINGKSQDTGFHVTTPSPLALQAYIKQARENGAKYIVLEVTSHALDQYRVHGIPFTVGVLTNITHEHLDYHKTYDKYVEVKVKLLEHSKIAVLNADDSSYPLVLKRLNKLHYPGKTMTYSLAGNADITAVSFPFHTKLIGVFNKYNILAAVCAARSIGLTDEVIKRAIASFTPPLGRTEIVHEGEFTVMIDFAHTPNSIEQLLTTIQVEMLPKGRIIHVFGSAGERDKQKREEMGRASASHADFIILTAEDPRSELITQINEDIERGIHKQRKINDKKIEVLQIPDRREAIREAVMKAKKGDIVIITGKGHERSLNLGHGETPWNEHEAVREALEWKKV